MSLLHVLREAPVAEQKPRRWTTLLEADPSIETHDEAGKVVGHAPAWRVEVEYCDEKDWLALSRKYRPRGQGPVIEPLWVKDLPSDKQIECISTFYRRFLTNWTGLVRENLPRFCPKACDHIALVQGLPTGELPYERETLLDLAALGTLDTFFGVWVAATSLSEFGSEVQAKNA